MNRLVKNLIILNGVLIPILIFFFFFQIAKSFIKTDKVNDDEEGIILDERLDAAKLDTLALQGLVYSEPRGIYNSSNYYLSISIMTYEEAKKLSLIVSSANDVSPSFFQYLNIVFLDSNYNVIGTLVEDKASIKEIEIRGRYDYNKVDEIDETYRNIGYLIAFEDTNNDGYLNSQDDHDLYISDLNGKNLTHVTEGIDIESFDFINSNSQIFISYTRRDGMKREHKREYFALYDINSKELRDMTSLNKKLDELERTLAN